MPFSGPLTVSRRAHRERTPTTTSPTLPRLVAAATTTALAASGLALAVPAPAAAGRDGNGPSVRQAGQLEHTGSFFLQQNLREGEPKQPTSAEIVAFGPRGRSLLYTDGLAGRLGFVDTRAVHRPAAAGSIDLPGDRTSVAVVGNHALVAVVTNEDPDGDGPLNEYDAPAGDLLVVDLRTREVVRTIPLAGQPDAVTVAPSGRYAVIVIENERDEDETDGLLPQPPAGLLQVLDLRGPGIGSLRDAPLTGLADIAPGDPSRSTSTSTAATRPS